MKKITKLMGVILALLFFVNCKNTINQQQAEITGNWEAQNTNITFRTKVRWMKYHFTKSKTNLTLQINTNQTISGSIGNVTFKDAKIDKNKTSASVGGIAYIVKCGIIGAINIDDSTSNKEIELWLKPITKTGILIAEIRLIDGWDTFPMGEAQFISKKQLNKFSNKTLYW